MEFVDSIPRQKSGKLLRRILSDRNKGFADYNMMLTPLLDSADTQTVLRLIACGHRGDSLCVHVRVAVLVRQSCTSTVTAVRAAVHVHDPTCNIRRATYSIHRTPCKAQTYEHNMQHRYNVPRTPCNMQHTTHTIQHATCNIQHVTYDIHSASDPPPCKRQHVPCASQHSFTACRCLSFALWSHRLPAYSCCGAADRSVCRHPPSPDYKAIRRVQDRGTPALPTTSLVPYRVR